MALAKDGKFLTPKSQCSSFISSPMKDSAHQKGEHSARECAINITALRLKAYGEYAKLPRPHLLALVARKTGSPASHLVSQTPDLDPQNTCEACQRPTTLTPFRIKPRCSNHELNTTTAATGTAQILINSAQDMLQEIVSPAQCAASPVTKGPSAPSSIPTR